MDLSTTYLGLKLSNPFMCGASPLTDDIDNIRRLEAGGLAAVVMGSLFEERMSTGVDQPYYEQIYARTSSAGEYPPGSRASLAPMQYFERISRLKDAVSIPVIASINCFSGPAQWHEYVSMIEEAGADALELNVYCVATDPLVSGSEIEKRIVDIVAQVRGAITIPLAVKLSPFFSDLPNLAHQLEEAGVNGLVLFNRAYQPDFDVERRIVTPKLRLSHASDETELRLRLRWLAILSPLSRLSLALSGGIHTGLDALKGIMAGAHAIQVVSSFLNAGPVYMESLLDQFTQQMKRVNAVSVQEIRGCLNLAHTPKPAEVERAQYVTALHSWPSP